MKDFSKWEWHEKGQGWVASWKGMAFLVKGHKFSPPRYKMCDNLAQVLWEQNNQVPISERDEFYDRY